MDLLGFGVHHPTDMFPPDMSEVKGIDYPITGIETINPREGVWIFIGIRQILGGGFKYFLFSPLSGEDSQFD